MTTDDVIVTDRLGRLFDLGAGTDPFQVAQDGRRPVLSRLEAEHLVGVLQARGIAATIEPAYPAGLRGVPREELPMPPADVVPVVVSPEQSPPADHGTPIAVQPFDTSELRAQIAALLAETEAASAPVAIDRDSDEGAVTAWTRSESAAVTKPSVPSDVPSSVPSDVPSSVPSDVPSSVPSDVPSSELAQRRAYERDRKRRYRAALRARAAARAAKAAARAAARAAAKGEQAGYDGERRGS